MTAADNTPDTLAAALAAYDAGLCVVRTATDGTKKPDGRWLAYQAERPDRDTVAKWFAAGHPGLGVICGAVSGNLEMLELEGRFMAPDNGARFAARAKERGVELLLKRIAKSYQSVSPSDGRHFLYRLATPIDGNTKLARDADHNTLIETRGEGGFVVLAPSHGPVHPTGKPWRIRNGSFAEIPTITEDERAALFDLCRSFDEAPAPKPVPPVAPSARAKRSPWTGGPIGDSWFDAVVDHLEHTTSVRNEIERHGWTYCYTDSHGRELFLRPGKDQGVSGSINTHGRLRVFSTSTPFQSDGTPPPTFDVLDVIAAYEHGGDRSAAARAIGESTGILAAWKAERAPAVQPPPNVDPETGEIVQSWTNLPDEFWNERPVLQHIRQAAHNRTRSADSVFLFVLARVATIIPPSVKLPPITGGAASLNFTGAVVSHSGGGKSTSGDVARELLPIDRKDIKADVPPGSGEGLTELYFEFVDEDDDNGKKRKVKRQVKSAAYIYLDEGQALAEMGSRKGATLLPTIRSAWSGQTIGQSNATQETHRVLLPHTYRMAIMVGFQYEYAAHLIADAAGGTPQRFVFASASDPSIPDEPPEWPGELHVDIPPVIHGEGTIMEFDPDVVAEIRQRALLQARGSSNPDPLDTHRDLVRMKVAALLARLEGRNDVNKDDWRLAGDVMRTSTAVRTLVIEYAKAAERRLEDARTQQAVRREAAIEDDATGRARVSGAKSIARIVRNDISGKPVLKGRLNQATSSKHRHLVSVDDMIGYAEKCRWIVPDGEGWKAGDARPD
jgi:hypothetical protein